MFDSLCKCAISQGENGVSGKVLDVDTWRHMAVVINVIYRRGGRSNLILLLRAVLDGCSTFSELGWWFGMPTIDSDGKRFLDGWTDSVVGLADVLSRVLYVQMHESERAVGMNLHSRL